MMLTNLVTTTLFESKSIVVLKISKFQTFPVVPPIPIVTFKNGGTAVHDFKGPYLTQNYYLPISISLSRVALI